MALERGATSDNAADPRVETKGLTVSWQGLSVSSAIIADGLDLSGLHFDHPIRFHDCDFGGPINLERARLGSVGLGSSRFFWLEADATHFRGDLRLASVWCLAVGLRGATIDGLLTLDGSILALDLFRQFHFVATPFLSKSEAKSLGGVPDRHRAIIDWHEWTRILKTGSKTSDGSPSVVDTMLGVLRRLADAKGINTAQARTALVQQWLEERDGRQPQDEEVTAWIDAINSWARAAVQALSTARDFVSSTPIEPVAQRAHIEHAINADNLKCGANIFIRDVKAFGTINLIGAEVEAGVAINRTFLSAKTTDNEFALIGQMAKLGQDMMIDATQVIGSCDFLAADMKGAFIANGSSVINFGATALHLNSARARVLFARDKSRFFGEVDIIAATAQGDLDLSGAFFCNPAASAVEADKVVIGGSVLLSGGFRSIGGVSLSAAKVGGNVVCDRGSFEDSSLTLDLSGCEIHGLLSLANVLAFRGTLNLIDAKADALADDCSLWGTSKAGDPTARLPRRRLDVTVELDGFSYSRFTGSRTPTDANCRIAWLKSQVPPNWQTELKPQPWQHCANVLAQMGHADQARRILYERERLRTRHQTPGVWPQIGRHILWATCGYGYYNLRAIGLSIAWVLIGTAVYLSAFQANLLERAPETSLQVRTSGVPSSRVDDVQSDKSIESSLQPDFHAFWYSLDVFVPVVDLRQAMYWIPKPVVQIDQGTGRTSFSIQTIIPAGVPLDDRTSGLVDRAVRSTWQTFVTAEGRLWIWTWLQIIGGWVLSTIAVLGFTGALERRDA